MNQTRKTQSRKTFINNISKSSLVIKISSYTNSSKFMAKNNEKFEKDEGDSSRDDDRGGLVGEADKGQRM